MIDRAAAAHIGGSAHSAPCSCRSQLFPLPRRVRSYLRRWAKKKRKRLRNDKRFHRSWAGLLERAPALFTHWQWVSASPTAGEKSPVTRDCHAGI
jgi:hypothetical protein